MNTLAVVCDNNIECANDRDEKLCATGVDKYDPLVYAICHDGWNSYDLCHS